MANKNHFDFDKIEPYYIDSPTEESIAPILNSLSEEDFKRVSKKLFKQIIDSLKTKEDL